MQTFSYAHKNTGEAERVTPTAQFNTPRISVKIQELREAAFKLEIPVADDETLCFLSTLVTALQPKKILELGTAVGVSGATMLEICPNAHLTTIEREQDFYNSAARNFKGLGFDGRVNLILGDAGQEIEKLDGCFDLIFMDCAKVQYIKYLPRLKRLLKPGGTLLADDVLLFGYVTGEAEVPKKRRMLVEHIREYIDAVTHDCELKTTILDVGNGIAMSVKSNEKR